MFPRSVRNYLSYLGVCNPRRAYNFLDRNQLMADGVRITDWNHLISSGCTLNGRILPHPEFTYIMMNKPVGYVCSRVSDRSPVVFDLLDENLCTGDRAAGLHTAGRLDKDTSGLLILTDDGAFSHYLASPEAHISKTYHAILDAPLSPAEQDEYERRFHAGLYLPPCEKASGFMTQPASLEWLDVGVPELGCASCASECLVTISEGKFHQVRRMFQVLGRRVMALKRISIGRLPLGTELAPGGYRSLSEDEIRSFIS